jgi:radical SAM protein with 4Fe4S-binding SPASM domain
VVPPGWAGLSYTVVVIDPLFTIQLSERNNVDMDDPERIISRAREARSIGYAVWEITLRCNLSCVHCGSRAGLARDNELTTSEALALVQQLADIGIGEVTLLGGEAYLRSDWEIIARAIIDVGMFCSMTTGSWGLSERLAERIASSGIGHVSVSIDGIEKTHDELRGRSGSWRRCFRALTNLQAFGVLLGVNTQLNRRSVPELPQLYGHLREARIAAWQVHLTGPMGRAADRPDLLLQPAELPVAYEILARVARRAWVDGIAVKAAVNVGYYGPAERLLRGGNDPYGFWQGPDQGLRTIGIESDGTVKPDLTLPTEPYGAGNIRDRSLRDILDSETFTFASNLQPQKLSGFCASCEFGSVCLGGDPWMAHVVLGEVGNNPYCDHRARSLAGCGRRERVQLDRSARGDPYDFGVFSLIEEPLDAPWPTPGRPQLSLEDAYWPEDWVDPPKRDQVFHSRTLEAIIPRMTDRPLPRIRGGSQLRRVGLLAKIKRRLDANERPRL